MSDEMPSRFIAFTPENLGFAIGPDRNVIVKLLGAEKKAGLTPGMGMMLVLTPTEARRAAEALIRTADKAEEGLPRA